MVILLSSLLDNGQTKCTSMPEQDIIIVYNGEVEQLTSEIDRELNE